MPDVRTATDCYARPPKHVTDPFMRVNWTQLGYDMRRHLHEQEDLSPTDPETQIDPFLMHPNDDSSASDLDGDLEVSKRKVKGGSRPLNSMMNRE